MNQIVCQLGLRKCIYLKQTSLAKLRDYVLADFQELPAKFDLMYIDEQMGDWMILQTQNDLDKVLKLKKHHFIFKILPSVQKQFTYTNVSQKKIGKLIISEEMKNMINFITTKHIQRFVQKKVTQKWLLQSDIMLEQKMPPSKTEFQLLPTLIEKNLMKQKFKGNKIVRVSPPKQLIGNKISKSVNCKLNQILPKLIDSSLQQFLNKVGCNVCSKKQLSMLQTIRTGLMRKAREKQRKP